MQSTIFQKERLKLAAATTVWCDAVVRALHDGGGECLVWVV